MKLAFNFKKKEASLQADVEGMIERGLESLYLFLLFVQLVQV